MSRGFPTLGDLGWRPQMTYRGGIAALVGWYGENREWAQEIVTL